MRDWRGLFETLFEVLRTDHVGCASVIRGAGGTGAGSVALLEGDLTVDETLEYARTLLELGSEAQAGELLRAALTAAFSVSLGSQRPPAVVPQGAQ